MNSRRLHELTERWLDADLSRQEEDELIEFARLYQNGEDAGFIVPEDDAATLALIDAIGIVADEDLYFAEETENKGESELETFLSSFPEKQLRGFRRRRVTAGLWSAAAVAMIVVLFAVIYNVGNIDRERPRFAHTHTAPALKPISDANDAEKDPMAVETQSVKVAVNIPGSISNQHKDSPMIKKLEETDGSELPEIVEVTEESAGPESLVTVSNTDIDLAGLENATMEMKAGIDSTLRNANEDLLAVFKDLSHGITDAIREGNSFSKRNIDGLGFREDCNTPECILAAAFGDIFEDRPGIRDDIDNSLRDIFSK